MNRIALFAALLSLGLMIAPAAAQTVGLGDLAEELDPVGEADAHYDTRCLKGPCVCWFDSQGYHCHYD